MALKVTQIALKTIKLASIWLKVTFKSPKLASNTQKRIPKAHFPTPKFRGTSRARTASPSERRGRPPPRDQLHKNRSSRKIDSRKLFSREYEFPKTFSLTGNQFSRKTHFYTIAFRSTSRRPWRSQRWWFSLTFCTWPCIPYLTLIIVHIYEYSAS